MNCRPGFQWLHMHRVVNHLAAVAHCIILDPAGVHQQGGYIVQQPPAYYSQPQAFYQAGYQQPPQQPVGYHAPPAYNASYNPAAEPPK